MTTIDPNAFVPLANLSQLFVDLQMLANFFKTLLNPETYRNTITPPKVVAEGVHTLPCNSSFCWLKKAEEKGLMAHYTFKDRVSRPVCSNNHEVFWDEADLGCSAEGRYCLCYGPFP